MSIIRFMDPPFFQHPWNGYEKMRRDMNQILHHIDQEPNTPFGAPVFPPLNIFEDADKILVRAEIAGVPSDNINISVEGETLTISGEKMNPPTDDTISYHRREIETGKFSRAVTLPTKITIEKISAQLRDGILTIALPKAEEAKPKKIAINVK